MPRIVVFLTHFETRFSYLFIFCITIALLDGFHLEPGNWYVSPTLGATEGKDVVWRAVGDQFWPNNVSQGWEVRTSKRNWIGIEHIGTWTHQTTKQATFTCWDGSPSRWLVRDF